jgi:hypothetical protein
MSRDFNSKNSTQPNINRLFYRGKWETEAYGENNGLGPNMIKDINFVERIHYGLIDYENNSIIPNEDFIVSTQHGRVFDFVADSYSLMRLNWAVAAEKGLVSTLGSAFSNLTMVDSYKNPRIRYGEYLGGILEFYNNTYIPREIGITNITSYEVYVKNFFDFIFKDTSDMAITMTRWNTSNNSSILDTGLAFSYAEIPMDGDQQKIDQIIDQPSFDYFKNLSLNMGFSIVHNNPNILLYDIASPAGAGIRESYGLYNLPYLFSTRYTRTYTIDNNMLYNNINIYYNKYVNKNPQTKVVKVECGQIVSEYIRLSNVPFNKKPYTDLEELNLYCKIRNLEEGSPFSKQKVSNIFKKAKYFLKKVDKAEAMGYINREYRDQVWNKDYGYSDLKKKIEGKTQSQSQRAQAGTIPSKGGSSSY